MERQQQLVGTVKTAFELHSLHNDQWLLVKEGPDLRQIEPAAALLIDRKEVDGVRIVRRRDYLDHDFKSHITVRKRLRPGVAETDPLQIANPGRDASWCDKPEDFTGDVQRQVIRGLFARYLDDVRVTPLEVLYYEVAARALDNAGTLVQGALQRLASQQVRGSQQSAVSRMKELMAMVDDGLSRLLAKAKGNPVPPLAPGGLKALSDKLAAGGADPIPGLYRATAAYLAGCKSWMEKLDRLFRLFSPELTVREMRIIDSIAAEIMGSSLALRELVGKEADRIELVLNAINLYVGKLGKVEMDAAGSHLPGVITLSELLAQGVLPRTLAELRLGLLRHLHARLPFHGERNIQDELRALVRIQDHLKVTAPTLVNDEEIQEAIALRADKLIQPEAMSDVMALARGTYSKINLILSLVNMAPGRQAKAKLAPYLRSLIVPDDIVWDMGCQNRRMDIIQPLSELSDRIQNAGLPETSKREMLDILDSALFETVRTEIVGNQAMGFADRMLALINTCGGLPEGRARTFASETLTTALRRPEFILNYLERFESATERRDNYFKLCENLAASRLVPPALIPHAAA
ncbi:hypothetical protein AZA_41338 [Nitrospirillum viridazoti Y2]|uniref:Uncharacterized protein n=2 Tax=Nitrospirillum TaxID=1543705 RepID=A0A248JQL9_9PROT|nr:hypothetical protein Y958_09440 [Nitrospirillum amazonense CBAmc]EGY00290.1 hypothetical protein AZA_41338 [Nitrospirillum amazonense Y2]TWB32481.1 hypothetical protein FBZ91_11783 [Nitrospirillum amazonense]TWB47811.1 hypothetical protein FBZ92_13266 [Nitrospirillum amazonense]